MRLDEEISELRKEITQFRTETRQRLEGIENEVNKQVSLNYNRTIIDYVTEMSHDLVENLKCDRPDEESWCKEKKDRDCPAVHSKLHGCHDKRRCSP